MSKKGFTWLYEFKDKKLELEYFRNSLNTTKHFFSILFFIYICLYFLFFILDLKLASHDVFIMLLINRIITSIVSLILLFLLGKSVSAVRSLQVINVIGIVVISSFLIAVFQYHNAAYFYIEALSILTLTLALFTLPASGIVKIIVSGVLNIGFFISMIILGSKEDAILNIAIIICFLSVSLFINILILFQSNYIKRINFKNTKKLEVLSSTDYLTGVLNRSKFMEIAENAMNDFNIRKHPLTFVYIDFDGFKSINDQFGHETGDRVLVEVANIIRENLTENDVFGRFGGDEFGILLIGKDLINAKIKADKIKSEISNYSVSIDYFASCTFGLHQLSPGEDIKEAIHLADVDMYQKKPAH
ncbi:MAG: GGDEF domain-containing protein [Clostridia bacterium]|nr:GGDEF domain-containing protein [Clostridia bacterium]